MLFSPQTLKDLWLSTINPLRGLTMSRVVSELEAGERGDYAMLQWLYRYIEKRDATLRGAKRRLRSSLMKLDWNVKIRSGLLSGDQKAAEEQQAFLKQEYQKITNLRKAIAHSASADFRGYAHLEKHFDGAGSIVKLEPVPQWHFCRDGMYGEWLFKEDASRGGIVGNPISAANFVVREVEDPINEIALIAFTRKGLSQKDFDAFIARYGIPFVFWILSEQMAQALATEPEKMNELMTTMRTIGSDGEGIFPGGTVETLDASIGGKDNNAFLQHLGYQDEQIVMAATSGKLTMLNEATGLGSGNADAHEATFDDLAIALAMEISEAFQEQIDLPLLSTRFPGQPSLVYFELAAKDSDDVDQLVDHASKLEGASIEMDLTQLSERTGYKLRRRVMADPVPTLHPASSRNRAKKPAPTGERQAADALLGGFRKLAAEFLSQSSDELAAVFAGAVDKPADEDEV